MCFENKSKAALAARIDAAAKVGGAGVDLLQGLNVPCPVLARAASDKHYGATRTTLFQMLVACGRTACVIGNCVIQRVREARDCTWLCKR
jgi:hypothetical protein